MGGGGGGGQDWPSVLFAGTKMPGDGWDVCSAKSESFSVAKRPRRHHHFDSKWIQDYLVLQEVQDTVNLYHQKVVSTNLVNAKNATISIVNM